MWCNGDAVRRSRNDVDDGGVANEDENVARGM